MKSVFARISTAIVAVAAVAASALVFAPAASATAGFNNPNVDVVGWYLNPASGAYTDTSVTGAFTPSAAMWTSTVSLWMTPTDIAAHAGHVIRVSWNKSFPAGAAWSSATMSAPDNGVSKDMSIYASGLTTTGNDPYSLGNTDSALWLSADTNTFTIPSAFSSAAAGDSLSINLGANIYGSEWTSAVAGNYSIAPTLYDVTTSTEIAIATSYGSPNTFISYKNSQTSGPGAFSESTVPAGQKLTQNYVTCVPVSSIVEGDLLKATKTVDSTTSIISYATIYKKGTVTSVGNSGITGVYTVTSGAVASPNQGIRISGQVQVDNTSGSSAASTPALDASVVKFPSGTTDFSTGGTAVNASCAPAALSAPTFTLTNLSNGDITWTKSVDDTGSNNYSYTVKVFRASNTSVPVYISSLYGTLNGNTFTGHVSGSFTANVDYVAKVVVRQSYDSVNSPDSPASSPSTKIIPPATPSAPTGLTINSSQARATLVVTDATASYTAAIVDSSSESTIIGTGTCNSSTPGGTTLTCLVSAMSTPFNAPATFKMKVRATKNNISSEWSALTAAVVGGYPGVTVTPSGGTGNGEAKSLTTSFPWITDKWSSAMGGYTPPKAINFSDGKGSYYILNDDSAVDTTARKYTLRKVKADNTGFDTTFGTVDKVVTGPAAMTNVQASVFAGSTKLALLTNFSNCGMSGCDMNVSPKTLLAESTLGGAVTSTVDVLPNVSTFCTANVDADAGNVMSSYVNLPRQFAALARPVLQVNCSAQNGQQTFLVTVAADGTFTKFATMNALNSTQNYLNSYSYSMNPNATGAQVGTVIYAVRSKRTSANGQTTYASFDRVLIRVAANGTATTETDVFTPTGSSEPSISLASINDGTTVYGLVNSMGVSSLTTIPVATGSVATPRPLVLDIVNQMGGSNFTFSQASVPNVGGEIALVRADFGQSGQSYGPARLTISSARVVTGEMLTPVAAGTPVNWTFLDAAGNLNLVYTPAVDPTPTTHTVIQWKNVRAMVAQPNPTYTSKDVAFSLNAGGATVKITGVDLALTTAAKKVLSVNVGAKNITAITKTATSITFVLPTSTLAGASGTVPVPVTINLGSGSTVSAGTVTYVGAAKLAQAITTTLTTTDAVVTTNAQTTAADRNLSAVVATTPSIMGAAATATFTAAPGTVCTIVADKVHFVGAAGTCTVTTNAATNAYLLAAPPVVKTITVSKADTITADVTGVTTDDSSDGFLPVISSTSGRIPTATSLTSAVCTPKDTTGDDNLVVLGLKSRTSGQNTCTIRYHLDADSTWAALDYDQTYTISTEVATGTNENPFSLTDNTGVWKAFRGIRISYKKSTGAFMVSVRSGYIGTLTANLKFTNAANKSFTCTASWGSTVKVTKVVAKDWMSPSLCTGANLTALKAYAATSGNKFSLDLKFVKRAPLTGVLVPGAAGTVVFFPVAPVTTTVNGVSVTKDRLYMRLP